MDSEYIRLYKLEVEIQDNGIIRDPFGWIIGRCNDEWFNTVVRHEPPGQPERTCRNASSRIDESRFHCSECGFGCWVKDVADGRDKPPAHCPNCGAKVVSE